MRKSLRCFCVNRHRGRSHVRSNSYLCWRVGDSSSSNHALRFANHRSTTTSPTRAIESKLNRLVVYGNYTPAKLCSDLFVFCLGRWFEVVIISSIPHHPSHFSNSLDRSSRWSLYRALLTKCSSDRFVYSSSLPLNTSGPAADSSISHPNFMRMN